MDRLDKFMLGSIIGKYKNQIWYYVNKEQGQNQKI